METKSAPEKDKFGKMGVLTWITSQNVQDLKETVNKYIQDHPDKEDPLIKRLVALNDQLHEIRRSMTTG